MASAGNRGDYVTSSTDLETDACQDEELVSSNYDIIKNKDCAQKITLPDKYRWEHYDYVMFYKQCDEERAHKWHKYMSDELGLNGILYEECYKLPQSEWTRVEIIIARSTYVVFYITQNIEDNSEIYELCPHLKDVKFAEIQQKKFATLKDMALTESILDPEKFDCMLPIFDDRVEYNRKKVPFGLRHLCGIKLSKNDVYKQFTDTFSDSVRNQRILRERKQEQDKLDYIEKQQSKPLATSPDIIYDRASDTSKRERSPPAVDGDKGHTIINVTGHNIIIGNQNVIKTMEDSTEESSDDQDADTAVMHDERNSPIENDTQVQQDTRCHSYSGTDLMGKALEGMTETLGYCCLADAKQEDVNVPRGNQPLISQLSDQSNPSSEMPPTIQPSDNGDSTEGVYVATSAAGTVNVSARDLDGGRVVPESNVKVMDDLSCASNEKIDSCKQVASSELSSFAKSQDANLELFVKGEKELDSQRQISLSEVISLNQIDSNTQMSGCEITSLHQIDSNTQMSGSVITSLNQIDSNTQMSGSSVSSFNQTADFRNQTSLSSDSLCVDCPSDNDVNSSFYVVPPEGTEV